jgi:hypothetical protein
MTREETSGVCAHRGGPCELTEVKYCEKVAYRSGRETSSETSFCPLVLGLTDSRAMKYEEKHFCCLRTSSLSNPPVCSILLSSRKH